MMLLATIPSTGNAEQSSSAEFLSWSAAEQDAYIQTSVRMAAIIGVQLDNGITDCIDHWYFADGATRTRRNAEIRALMKQYASYHPSTVILSAINRECGSFAVGGR